MEAPKPLIQFADGVGEFIEHWGFKRVHGQIWAHLYLSVVPLDANELISRLQVSKALISLSIKELLQYGVIEKAGKSGKGTQLYQANPDLISVICSVLRQRERQMIAGVAASLKQLASLSPEEQGLHGISASRISTAGMLVQLAENVLDGLLTVGQAANSSAAWAHIRASLPGITETVASTVSPLATQFKKRLAVVESAFSLLKRSRIS